MHKGASPSAPPNCVRAEPAAIGPISESNSCVDW
jgi:hypothetical protein